MTRVEEFKAEHYHLLRLQDSQAYMQTFIEDSHLKTFENMPGNYTIFSGSRVVFCGGVIELFKGRGTAWAVFSGDCKKEFLAIHNCVKRCIEVSHLRRIEATVDEGFKAGHRWLRLLGFELEAPVLRAYGPDGRNSSLYARVR